MEVGTFNKQLAECESFEERFLYYMKNLPIFVDKPDTHNEEFFEELLEAAEYAGLSKDMKEFYDHRLKNLRDNQNADDYAKRMAIKEDRINIAKNLLAMGLTPEQASQATGLTVEEVKGLS